MLWLYGICPILNSLCPNLNNYKSVNEYEQIKIGKKRLRVIIMPNTALVFSWNLLKTDDQSIFPTDIGAF